jgi:hypothetical protein
MISTNSLNDPDDDSEIISPISQTEDEWIIETAASTSETKILDENVGMAIKSLEEDISKIKVESIEGDSLLVKAIESLKEEIVKLKIETTSEMVKHHVETKKSITKLEEQMVKLNHETKKSNAEMIEINKVESKRRNLEWAMANSDAFSFSYNRNGVPLCKSSIIVKVILMYFRRGVGSTITNCYSDRNCNEESNIAFRKLLQNQIFQLTGMKPRIEPVSKNGSKDDIFEIYYC